MERTFKKVLVANRGEIAMRIFRACHDLGLQTIAIYSNEDTYSLFRTAADESYLIGENESPLGAYLNIDRIIRLAKKHGADAIHPGYGFLSENGDFARACEAAGIQFIGPSSRVLDMMGDKLSAKQMALECGVPTTPGTAEPLKDRAEAQKLAVEFGFPVILKAAAGGGGRGMRRCDTVEDVGVNFDLVKAEAKKAFGNDDIFMEKFLVEPKHIEIQVLGDEYGNVVHLYERDCSLQRRYQKVVEFTPAFSVAPEVRQALCDDAVKIARHVGYVNAGTLEFLVDKDGHHYFIEMNPRIQVEHTVTEVVTGIDLVRSQILIAEGKPLSDPEIGITSQADIHQNGYAIQCRITTEDPANNFAPDTGKITSYRSSGGFGIRLDGGNAYTGAVISPYYDSLLVKVTTWDNTFAGVCRKAARAINEVHVRGVKTNIAFITNILKNPTFIAGGCHTKFIDETPELFQLGESQDRATKMLKYIGNIVVKERDGHKFYDAPRFPPVTGNRPDGLKQLLDAKGPKAVADWVLAQKKLLITDTTCRDAHQSLLATRVRTRDIVKGMDGTSEILSDAFSLECWGGATFDVAYRFLHESPWERLDLIRQKAPNLLLQMLLRGANAVGYTNYPDNVIREFIKEAARSGIDVFRIFDSLNWIPGMEVAMDEVLKQDKICQATICYTGDILDPKRDKYTLDYYVKMAKELEHRGAHMLAIKDMSGLLKPYAAKKLVSTLKQEIGIPIQLHTHDTTGNQVAALLLAAEAGLALVLLWSAGVLRKPAHVLCAALLLAAAFVLRGLCLNYETSDYTQFLTVWVDFFRTHGGLAALREPVGNYNVPYLTFLALISGSSLSDLHLIKLFSIFFDVVLAWSVMQLVGLFRREAVWKLSAFFLVLFWPTVVLNGALWGQCDSVYASLAVLSVYLVLAGHPVLGVVSIAAAFSFKLQAVFIMPVFLLFWLTRRVRLRHALAFPATCVVMVLPAVIARRGLWDALTIPFQQTGSIGTELNYNASSVFALVTDVREPDLAAKLGIGAAALVIVLLAVWFWLRRNDCSDRALVLAAALLAIAIPFFLPHMHDRYFFAADALTLALAAAWPQLTLPAVLCEFASLLGYHAYLRMRYLLPMADGALALIAALIILAAVLALELQQKSPLHEKLKKST